jgi:hypothetical protein
VDSAKVDKDRGKWKTQLPTLFICLIFVKMPKKIEGKYLKFGPLLIDSWTFEITSTLSDSVYKACM